MFQDGIGVVLSGLQCLCRDFAANAVVTIEVMFSQDACMWPVVDEHGDCLSTG